MILVMIGWLRHLLGWLLSAFHSRQDLILENLALRQQLLVLRAQRPRRRFTPPDKLFWVLLRKAWDGWKRPLLLVTPRTVVDWHRAGFRLYWKWLSRIRSGGGRKPVSEEIRALIFQMVAENPTWGAPRIHGELLMLGFKISEATVSRWMRRAPRSPQLAHRWLTFAIPTLTFGVLYGFFVIRLMSKNMGMLHWAFKKRARALGLVGLKEPRLSFRSFIESYRCQFRQPPIN